MHRLPTLAIAMLALASSSPAWASSVIVPDEIASVQAAFDSGADSLLIRGGSYSERLTVHRPVTLLGIGPTRPWLAGLHVYNYGFHVEIRKLTVIGLGFRGQVELITADYRTRFLTMSFTDCVLDSGLLHVDNSDVYDIALLEIHNSHLIGGLFAIVNAVSMVADTIDGKVDLRIEEDAQIRGCWFRGGPGTAIRSRSGEIGGSIASNTIENYDSGIHLSTPDGIVISDNVIKDVPGRGIYVAGGGTVTLRNNRILNCGIGMRIYCDFIHATDNTVLGSQEVGIWFEPNDNTSVSGNIVGDSGTIGLLADMPPYSGDVSLRNNTVYRSGTSALVVYRQKERRTGTVQVSNNIGCNSGEWGFWISPDEPVTLSCNDWFDNALGMTVNVDPGATDLNVDPLFCDDSEGEVALTASSPLLDAPGCGLIGARGLGCGATPVLVALLQAEPAADGVRIEWRWGGLERPASFWIDRTEDASGPWARIATDRRENDGITVDWDRDVEPGRSYFYRLAWIAENGDRSWSEPITATVLGPTRFALESTKPNPSSGPVEIAWSLPRAGDIDIAIFDIAGREVARLASGAFAAGNHRTTWNGLCGSTAPGLYFVRLRYDGREIARRILLRR